MLATGAEQERWSQEEKSKAERFQALRRDREGKRADGGLQEKLEEVEDYLEEQPDVDPSDLDLQKHPALECSLHGEREGDEAMDVELAERLHQDGSSQPCSDRDFKALID
uniref:Uncharacterized protein n=1 Tax=Sphaerodactylus townsendi TaxID=933632 RepID=A0ACB8FX84_9SAUR